MIAIHLSKSGYLILQLFDSYSKQLKTQVEEPHYYRVLKSQSLTAAFVAMYDLEYVYVTKLITGAVVVLPNLSTQTPAKIKELRRYRNTLQPVANTREYYPGFESLDPEIIVAVNNRFYEVNFYLKAIAVKDFEDQLAGFGIKLLLTKQKVSYHSCNYLGRIQLLQDTIAKENLNYQLEKLDENVFKVTRP